MVLLVIAAAATTLTVALALSGVTNQPYQQTRLATAGPDVIAVEGGGPGPAQPVSSAQLAATVASLTTAPGVTAHSGPYPTALGVIRFRGHTVDVVAEGRDRAPASVDQPKVTQGGWIRPGAVVIERGFADALGVHVGDSVRLGGRSFRVAGIAVTAAVPPYPSSLCHIACPFPVPMGKPRSPEHGPGVAHPLRRGRSGRVGQQYRLPPQPEAGEPRTGSVLRGSAPEHLYLAEHPERDQRPDRDRAGGPGVRGMADRPPHPRRSRRPRRPADDRAGQASRAPQSRRCNPDDGGGRTAL